MTPLLDAHEQRTPGMLRFASVTEEQGVAYVQVADL